jgi:uncharacterized protein YbjT (DUF2867 family)
MFVIAGATGHVGSVAADRLLAAAKPVRVIVRSPDRGTSWSSRGAEVATGDLGDAAFVGRALQGASGFFTLLPPDYGGPDFFASQRRVADAVASAVRASGVPHVVVLSSLGADLPTGTGPIKGLHYFEERLRETGAKITALRPAYFQENAASALGPARNAGIFPNFGESDDFAWPMTATRDIGEQVALALLNPSDKSEVIDLIGPEYSARDIASALGRTLGKDLRMVNSPKAQWVPTLRGAGLPPSASEALAEMYGALRSGIIQPRGDRQVRTTTPLDETVRTLTARS